MEQPPATDDTTPAAPTAPPELVIRVQVTPKNGGIFEARALCEIEGERFEGAGIDANAHAAVAAGGACARLLMNLSERWEKVEQLGPDVVVRRKSRKLLQHLDRMFRPHGLAPRQLTAPMAAPPEVSGHPSRPFHDRPLSDGPLVVGWATDDDDDDDDENDDGV